jgi:3-hydroxybutyryl-CoA dehydratase
MMLALRILYFEDLSVGMTETLSKTIAASDVVGFAQLTGDRNPIHLSEHFAAKTQFGKRIAHGLYTASLIPERQRARLACSCTVADEIVLDGEAWVKVPSAAKSKRPLPRL